MTLYALQVFAQMGFWNKPQSGYLDQNCLDSRFHDLLEQLTLRLTPHPRQRCQFQPTADALHSQSLIVRCDRPRTDALQFWNPFLNALHQSEQILHFIPVAPLVPELLCGGLSPGADAEEWQSCGRESDGTTGEGSACALGVALEDLVPDRLVHEALEVGGTHWGDVAQSDDFVAVAMAEHQTEAGVLPAADQRQDLHFSVRQVAMQCMSVLSPEPLLRTNACPRPRRVVKVRADGSCSIRRGQAKDQEFIANTVREEKCGALHRCVGKSEMIF